MAPLDWVDAVPETGSASSDLSAGECRHSMDHARDRSHRGGLILHAPDRVHRGTVVIAERNRVLQALTGRSHSSIEFEHQNISAVMSELGLPLVRGYKPARNYQGALFEGVDAHLRAHGLHDSLAWTASMGVASPTDLVHQPAPILSNKQKKIDPDIHTMSRRFDPAVRDSRARVLGEAGEVLLFQTE